MSRIRTIKPEFFKHEDLFDAEKETGLPLRLAFVSLWTVADREGRFKWRPRMLKTECLPYDDCDFEQILNSLASYGFIVKYEVGGEQFAHIPSWHAHQHVNQRESASTLPSHEQGAVMHVHARGEGEGEGEGEREREGKEIRDANASLVNVPVDLTRKRIERSQSDQALLDRITDRWNAWAKPKGLPAVALLTDTRAQHCRRRIADLQALTKAGTPEEAFDQLLAKCEASFFIRGSPRSKLKFDQLMRESFMAQMMENGFQHEERKQSWQR